MSIIDAIYKFLISFKTTLVLFFIFAAASGVATFIENDFSTQTAQAEVYYTKWFEVVMILLIINLIGNIIRFKMYRKEKIMIFLFHASFVMILIGAGVTRYIGYEGVMPIKEGQSSNWMISTDGHLLGEVKDNKNDQVYLIEKKLVLSQVSDQYFKEEFFIRDIPVKVEYDTYHAKADHNITPSTNGEGKAIIELAVAIDGQPFNLILQEGEVADFDGTVVSFDPKIQGLINFTSDEHGLFFKSNQPISTLKMSDQSTDELNATQSHRFESRKLHKIGSFNAVLKDYVPKATLSLSESPIKKSANKDALVVKTTVYDQTQTTILFGIRGVYPAYKSIFALGELTFTLSYGSKIIELPFRIHLNDFILDRYPGSNSPSSYKSEVVLIDQEMKIEEERAIFMNNILEHRGYRFYQSSYEPDESGTVLSVNHDLLGTIVTYVGYIMLTLGMVLAIFSRKSRFATLYKKLNKQNLSILFALALTLSLTSGSLYANNSTVSENTPKIGQKLSTQELFAKLNAIDEEHASRFGRLSIQATDGRMQPVNSFAYQIVRKVTGKDSISKVYSQLELTPDQTLLGMLVFPDAWQKVKMIRVKDKQIKQELGLTENAKYASFADFFDYNSIEPYRLAHSVEIANNTKPALRNRYDKEIIKIDEKVNILYMAYSGSILRVFPYPNRDETTEEPNLTWYSPIEAVSAFPAQDGAFVRNVLVKYFSDIASGTDGGSWDEADKSLLFIKQYQDKVSNLTLDENLISLEIFYNKHLIFDQLKTYYALVGLILFVLILIDILTGKDIACRYSKTAKYLIILGFAIHTMTLALRWYLSGHAPWSNGYESVIYVSWAILLSGILLSRHSLLALSASSIMSAVALFVAHLSWLDPEITNLVPVLKSYWLTIHVSVITGSYGFFALGFVLGIVNMLLMIARTSSNQGRINPAINDLTIINEMALFLGLILLTIGNFLGGVWANESWGRYWGWDAKETWALVSILVYAIVAHLRFIPKLKGAFVFNFASIVAFFSIIMTYFGVNFYLAGLHSYAKGDPVPIPDFIYYMLYTLAIIIIVAFLRDKKATQ